MSPEIDIEEWEWDDGVFIFVAFDHHGESEFRLAVKAHTSDFYGEEIDLMDVEQTYVVPDPEVPEFYQPASGYEDNAIPVTRTVPEV